MSEIAGQAVVQSSSIIWKIDDFCTKCSDVGEFIKSPIFEFGDYNRKTYWNLQLYPFGFHAASKHHLSLFLTFLNQSTTTECVCTFEMSILKDDQVDLNTVKLCKNEIFCITRTAGWRYFIERNELLYRNRNLLSQKSLTIKCIISEISMDKTSQIVSSLDDEYGSLYLTGDFSDVTIVIGHEKIKAHKAILSARSKVFSAMLKHDMAETNSNIITISDVEYNVMEKFVSFLYSRKVDDLKEFAKPLLAVAHKYDVNDLKFFCENTLLSGLTVDNACELVSIAELYSCFGLQSKIIDYMIENIRAIMKTESFDDLLSSNQTLFKKIFNQLVEKYFENKQTNRRSDFPFLSFL